MLPIYRGRRQDGSWVSGCLIYDPEIMQIMGIISNDPGVHPLDMPYMNDGCVDGHFPTVDPKTVGMYTGLKDRNGKRIFEGDVVKQYFEGTGREYFDGDADYEYDYYGHKLGVVAFTGTGARLKCYGGKFVRDGETLEGWKPAKKSALAAYRCEVIGNIHDNPTLLEV